MRNEILKPNITKHNRRITRSIVVLLIFFSFCILIVSVNAFTEVSNSNSLCGIVPSNTLDRMIKKTEINASKSNNFFIINTTVGGVTDKRNLTGWQTKVDSQLFQMLDPNLSQDRRRILKAGMVHHGTLISSENARAKFGIERSVGDLIWVEISLDPKLSSRIVEQYIEHLTSSQEYRVVGWIELNRTIELASRDDVYSVDVYLMPIYRSYLPGSNSVASSIFLNEPNQKVPA